MPKPLSLPVLTLLAALAAGCGGGSDSSSAPPPAPAPTAPDVKFSVARLQMIQVTQNPAGEVPLFANRDGLLRVFVTADQANDASPPVRVDVFHDGALTASHTIDAPRSAVPTTIDAEALDGSWNIVLPAAVVRPGLAVRATVDPGGAAVTHPASGPLALDVRTLPPLRMRIVPVRYGDHAVTVDQTDVGIQTFFFGRTFPVAELDIDIRQQYTTTAIQDDGQLDMEKLLEELKELRLEDGSDRYYYGNIVWLGAAAGERVIAGVAFIAAPIALGQHRNALVFAHEVGHNYGLRHAPCGSAPNTDANYPYSGGAIGVPGWDVADGRIRQSTERDLMSYCLNFTIWISDYHYGSAFAFRESEAVDTTAEKSSALVVWGGIDDDGITLRPSFISTAAASDTPRGALTAEGYDKDGTVLFSQTFAATEVAHGTARKFSLRVPLSDAQPDRLTSIRVSGEGHVAELRRTTGPAELQSIFTSRIDYDSVRVTWDADRYPLAVIRDGETDAVLSFAEGGEVVVGTRATTLTIGLGDGVTEARTTLHIER